MATNADLLAELEALLARIVEDGRNPKSLTLQAEELLAVTGYKRPHDQAEYVRSKYGVPAHVNGADKCVVIRAHLEAAQSPTSEPARKKIR